MSNHHAQRRFLHERRLGEPTEGDRIRDELWERNKPIVIKGVPSPIIHHGPWGIEQLKGAEPRGLPTHIERCLDPSSHLPAKDRAFGTKHWRHRPDWN